MFSWIFVLRQVSFLFYFCCTVASSAISVFESEKKGRKQQEDEDEKKKLAISIIFYIIISDAESVFSELFLFAFSFVIYCNYHIKNAVFIFPHLQIFSLLSTIFSIFLSYFLFFLVWFINIQINKFHHYSNTLRKENKKW